MDFHSHPKTLQAVIAATSLMCVHADVAFEEANAAAQKGVAEAQYRVAKMYATGKGVAENDSEAWKWFQKAADQGNADAQFMVAQRIFNGAGVPKNYDEGVKWYRKAAEQNHLESMLFIGLMYVEAEDIRDLAQAKKWFRKAADQGSSLGEYYVGALTFSTGAVANDRKEGLKWLHKAADKSEGHAQNLLGMIYRTGQGVPKDAARAHVLFILAAAQVNRFPEAEMAQEACAELEVGMTPEQIAAGRAKAGKWAQVAADQGNPDAQYALSYLYCQGQCVPKDVVKAYAYGDLAAKSGRVDMAELWREDIAKGMTVEQIAKGRRLASEWKPTSLAK
jgi:uncharacterized protein